MNLLELSCQAQHGSACLADEQQTTLLAQLPGWHIAQQVLSKTFSFTNYYQSIAFVNALAWIAHQQDHHPDLSVHYQRVVVQFSTHDAGGLTLNDFICAAKTEALAHS